MIEGEYLCSPLFFELMKLDASYWNQRYLDQHTPWDVGEATRPISAYFQQIYRKDHRILFPGAGHAHEAEWLHRNGFSDVSVIDFSAQALQNFQARFPNFPAEHLIQKDFFTHKGQYDYIVEQTFYCAIAPDLRDQYVQQMARLLKPGGKLVGLLFDFPLDLSSGPPFGGDLSEYQERFNPCFKIQHLESCYNSIKPRQGRELFIELIRKA